MDSKFHKNLAFYTAKFAERQAEQDIFDTEFGIEKIDLAIAAAMAKYERRLSPRVSWESQKERFKYELELQRYSAAIGE